MDPRRRLGDEEQRHAAEALQVGLVMGGLDVHELWAAALGLGPMFGPDEVAAVVEGRRGCSALEYDLLAQALNDRFVEQGRDHPVPYSDGLV